MPVLSLLLSRVLSPIAPCPHPRLRTPVRVRAPGGVSLVLVLSVGSLVGGGLLGCSDLGGKPPLPSGIPKQEALKTPAGARQLYQGALATFQYGRFNGGPPAWGALLSSRGCSATSSPSTAAAAPGSTTSTAAPRQTT